MKTQIFLGLFLLGFNSMMGQSNFLKDTLIRDSIVLPNEKTITVFKDFGKNIDDLILKSPTADDGSSVEYLVKGINTEEEMGWIIHDIFLPEEINRMQASNCYINLRATTSGKIVSTTFLFLRGDPEIEKGKLIKFSQRIKNRITLDIHFFKEVMENGYVEWSYHAF